MEPVFTGHNMLVWLGVGAGVALMIKGVAMAADALKATTTVTV